jgi:hypothetical protein
MIHLIDVGYLWKQLQRAMSAERQLQMFVGLGAPTLLTPG